MITFRLFKIDDYQDLISLWNKAGLPCKTTGRDSLVSICRELRYSENKTQQINSSQNIGELILAFVDNTLIGSILATTDGRKGWINRLAIDPSHRNMGLALDLIKKGEESLQAKGIKIIACLIEDQNKPSIALFAKAGYVYHKDISYYSKRDNSDV